MKFHYENETNWNKIYVNKWLELCDMCNKKEKT